MSTSESALARRPAAAATGTSAIHRTIFARPRSCLSDAYLSCLGDSRQGVEPRRRRIGSAASERRRHQPL